MMPMTNYGGLLIVIPYGQQIISGEADDYFGFDGVLWSGLDDSFMEACLIPEELLEGVERLFEPLRGTPGARLLFVSDNPRRTPAHKKFGLIGIDVGYFESCYGKFSCLLNELGRGLIDDHEHEWALNQSGLFDDPAVAQDFLENRLAMKNDQLETIEPSDNPTLIYIYRYSSEATIGGR